EVLEGRDVPSTLTVLNTNDSGPGSLRDTIAAAQSGDTINFDPSLAGRLIYLTSGELAITKNLTITGTSGNPEVVDGSVVSRAFDITGRSACVTLNNLATFGVASDGGGIRNLGFLTVNSCNLGGVAENRHNAEASNGGAVDNLGTMVINNS